MNIKKDKNAALNYGCLMAELKEKIELFRDRLEFEDCDDENQNNRAENGQVSETESIGRVSQEEGEYDLRVEPRNESLSPIGDDEECRLQLSADSKVFPYPICFVSRSLPTPPKDYNLRKTGINLKEKKYSEPEISLKASPKKLSFLVDKASREQGKLRGLKQKEGKLTNQSREQGKQQCVCQGQKANLFLVGEDRSHMNGPCEPNKGKQFTSSENKGPEFWEDMPGFEKEKIESFSETQGMGNTTKAADRILRREQGERSFGDGAVQGSQSLENMRICESNLSTKNRVSGTVQHERSLTEISASEKVGSKTLASNDDDHNLLNNSLPNAQIKRRHRSHQFRSNIITTRYYRMASQLRVIN
ncbi:hypothetical protein HWI79_3578 [Cryptosporidium felis]|nr:hypothetical protein HWI79_3578 [Cryptosporidium felis]